MHGYRYDINVNIPREPIWNVVIIRVAKFAEFHDSSVITSVTFLRKHK